MAHTLTLRALAVLALLLPLAACRSAPREQAPDPALWVPNARAGLATVNRSTSYAIEHAADTELLIYEVEDRTSAGKPTSRLTWLIEVRAGAPLDRPLELVPGPRGGASAPADSATPDASGWLLEQIDARPAHAARLRGTITIAQRTGEAVSGVVNVYAVTSAPGAGEAGGGRVRLARRIQWHRHTPETIGSSEPETRAGITHEQQGGDTKRRDER